MQNKTVYIIGAGASSKFGLPTTDKQIEIFDEINTDQTLIWKLKQIIEKLFGHVDGKLNCTINDVYNLIDSNLLLHSGLFFEEVKIEAYQLEQCKKELVAYIFKKLKEKISDKNDVDYNKYVDFYYELAKNELEIKKQNINQVQERDFFISSYSIINFNWDLFSIMPIIESHSKLNHENRYYLPINRNPSLRIYVDFNCEYGKNDTAKLWYPFTESAAFATNSEKYDTKRRVVLTKCFYPHGSMNLFKCPSCAKHSYYLGNLTLKDVEKKLNYDKENSIYECPYCGCHISGMDFDALIQSNFKTRNSYFEEIRLSMTNELRNAKRLIFMGYSLPNDDVDYKTMFKSLNNIQEVYVVLKSDNSINEFIEYEKLKEDEKNKVKNFAEIFRGKKLFFNFAGIPNAFDKIVALSKK